MVHKELQEIREDIDIILLSDVEKCKSAVPHTVFNLTGRLKDILHEKKINDKEYKDEVIKLSALTERFQNHCKCSEERLYIPKLAIRPPPVVKLKAEEFDTTLPKFTKTKAILKN